MGEASVGLPKRHREGIVSAISAGLFLVVIGAIFVVTPNFLDKLSTFFGDFGTVRVPHLGIDLPAPLNPGEHTSVYLAAEQFSIVWGIYQVAVLGLRFVIHSSARRKAETLSNAVYWFGNIFLIQTYLLGESTRWFEFWAMIIALLGISLIVRALFLAAVPREG
jgi:hypothetical protein